MNIENVVKVDINLSKALVSQKNFGRGLILGVHTRFAERFRIYNSLEDVAVDFQVTDPEYQAAKGYFSPAVAPADLMIGRGDELAKQSNVVSETALAAAIYTVTINGEAFSVDYSGGAPANSSALFTAIKALIDGSDQPVVSTLEGAAPNEDLKIEANDFSVSFTLVVGANLASVVNVQYIGVDTNLNVVSTQGGGSDWYGLILTSRTVADILKAASWIESAPGRFVFIGCSDQADVLTDADDDVASLIKASNYARTDFFWQETDELPKYPEAVWFGVMLPKAPGSATFNLKTLPGIIASDLTSGEVANLIAKRASYYVTIGGVDVTQGSTTGDGDFIDIQVGIDWLRATMEQNIFALLASVDKVPFTDGGIQMVGNVVTATLKSAVDPQDVLASYTTDFPVIADFTPQEKQTRILDKMKFGGVMAGAIHKVNVVGNLSF